MSSHSFRYILSTHTHWWGLTNAAPYISKCLDILLIPATSHILFTNQFLDPAGAAAVELSAMPKVRGCRFWQNMVSSRGKTRVDFTEKTVDLNGFHLQTVGICGA